jgi:hypothetical protein
MRQFAISRRLNVYNKLVLHKRCVRRANNLVVGRLTQERFYHVAIR